MIHRSSLTTRSCTFAHSSRGVATIPARQKSLSSSITGRPVTSPKRMARVDLPDAPGPKMSTRFTLSSALKNGFGKVKRIQQSCHMEDNVFDIPLRLKWLEASPVGRAWLRDLPARVQACADLWALQPGPPYPESYVS